MRQFDWGTMLLSSIGIIVLALISNAFKCDSEGAHLIMELARLLVLPMFIIMNVSAVRRRFKGLDRRSIARSIVVVCGFAALFVSHFFVVGYIDDFIPFEIERFVIVQSLPDLVVFELFWTSIFLFLNVTVNWQWTRRVKFTPGD